ncbi:MAG: PilW family protein, partial [Gammaproteobacteria bacterium]|nr:PilW family protein [Gammaproteobacteria bacterium]
GSDCADGDTSKCADTRKYHVHVYFVAPCSFGTGAQGVCQSGDDEVPTLKRLELGSDGSDTVMEIVPLVEGVEYMKVEYGIDNSPTDVNDATGLAGDGVPDTYKSSPSVAEWPLAVSARIHVLARNVTGTVEYSDAKTYQLAGMTAGPFGDTFKRRLFSTEVRPMNLAGRREIPK